LPAKDDESEAADFLREIMQPQSRSFNETLAARPAVEAQPLRDALAERLQGFAEWDEEDPARLIFTDPNGTRPGTPEQVARWIAAPLPFDPATGDPFPQMQAEALDLFAADPTSFATAPHRDRWADFAR